MGDDMTLEQMAPDKRFLLAEEICEIFVKYEAEAQEAISAIRIVMDLIPSSGLAVVKGEVCEAQGVPHGASAYRISTAPTVIP
jgi:hypothetical protein